MIFGTTPRNPAHSRLPSFDFAVRRCKNPPYLLFMNCLFLFLHLTRIWIRPPVSAAVASTIPSNAPLALNALLIMAHMHGVAASGADLLHRFSANGKDLNQEEWLLAVRYLGLKVRAVSRSISRLHLLALPAVVWQPDGQHFILARVDDGQFLIQDLAAGKPLLLSLPDFSARFSGQLILVASRTSILGSLAKFDFTWFIPAGL